MKALNNPCSSNEHLNFLDEPKATQKSYQIEQTCTKLFLPKKGIFFLKACLGSSHSCVFKFYKLVRRHRSCIPAGKAVGYMFLYHLANHELHSVSIPLLFRLFFLSRDSLSVLRQGYEPYSHIIFNL